MIKISSPIITEKDINDVAEVLRSGLIVQGPKVKQLEKNFAKYCGTKYAIAVNSGTAAIHTALFAIGVKEGDEVVTTPFTFVATANPILMVNAKIKFVDIDEENFCIDPDKTEAVITEKTKAIIPVSLYGLPYSQEINKIAEKFNLHVLEDAAQSVGAKVDNKKSGNLADIAAFSLYATKNIMSAEGGMITTNNPDYAELCRRFRHHGQSEKTRYEYQDLGYNYRMTDINAAIGLNQLSKVEEFIEKRIQNAKMLSEGLTNIIGIRIPSVPKDSRHVFHQYTIRLTKDFKISREELKKHLEENGIGTGIYYPKPLHLHPHFQRLGFNKGDFPVAEKISKEVLSLPVHPSLTKSEINKIIETIQYVSKQ